MSQALHPMLNTAIKAARAAGAIINRASLDLERLQVNSKAPNDFVTEVDHAAEAAIIDTLLSALPRPRHPRRGVGQRARRARQRVRLDHRPARRHHQLHPRPADLRGLDRPRLSQPGPAGRRLRPGAQRPLLRVEGPRRLPQRQAAARLEADAHGRRADRHRLSVPQGRRLRPLPAHPRDGDEELRRRAPARRRRARPLLRRRRLVRRLLRDRALALGRRRRARCSSPRPAAWSATSPASPTSCTSARSSPAARRSTASWCRCSRRTRTSRAVRRTRRRRRAHQRCERASADERRRADRPHADDAAVPAHQGRASRHAPLLPDGRLLRAVPRRREARASPARHHPDRARRERRRADRDGRRAGARGRRLPRQAGPPRRVGRDLRAGRRGRRDQGTGRAQGRPHRHAGDADRERPARREERFGAALPSAASPTASAWRGRRCRTARSAWPNAPRPSFPAGWRGSRPPR